jgi:hypothetical protein
MLRSKEHIPTPPSIVFTFGFVVECIKELGGASYKVTIAFIIIFEMCKTIGV